MMAAENPLSHSDFFLKTNSMERAADVVPGGVRYCYVVTSTRVIAYADRQI